MDAGARRSEILEPYLHGHVNKTDV